MQAHKHCLWLECTSNKSTNTEQININTEQIVELFCRKDISTTVEGRHESHHIVCLLFAGFFNGQISNSFIFL